MTDDLDQLDEEVGTRLITIACAEDGSLSIDYPGFCLWEVIGALHYLTAMVEDDIDNEIQDIEPD